MLLYIHTYIHTCHCEHEPMKACDRRRWIVCLETRFAQGCSQTGSWETACIATQRLWDRISRNFELLRTIFWGAIIFRIRSIWRKTLQNQLKRAQRNSMSSFKSSLHSAELCNDISKRYRESFRAFCVHVRTVGPQLNSNTRYELMHTWKGTRLYISTHNIHSQGHTQFCFVPPSYSWNISPKYTPGLMIHNLGDSEWTFTFWCSQ